MPIYEYRCDECNACFEKLVFSGKEESIRCPECESKKVRRQMSCVSAAGSSSCKSSNAGFS